MLRKPIVAVTVDFLEAMSNIPKIKQKKVWEFAEKYTENPDSPGINYEKLRNVRDSKIRTVRIDLEYRAVVLHPPQGNVYTVVWVDHHDEAINWAKNREFKIHHRTGLLHVFNIDESVLSRIKEQAESNSNESLFRDYSDKKLQLCGVPTPLLPVVRNIRNEEELVELRNFISIEIYEALLCLAAGYSVDETIEELIFGEEGTYDPEDFTTALMNPSNRRKFTVVETVDELSLMLEAPMEKWRVFLHPTQEKLIYANFSGPALVTGGPGTGKTVVAMHRAKYLAERIDSEEGKILFTTFTSNLAQNIKRNLASLCPLTVFNKLEVTHLHSWVYRYLNTQGLKFSIPTEKQLQESWKEAVAKAGERKWELSFCREEWETVIQHHGIQSLEEYLQVVRYGRGIRLSERERKELFKVFESFIAAKKNKNLMEWNDVLEYSRELLIESGTILPYSTIIVDEAQDMEPSAFRLLGTMVPNKEDDLFIVGEVHQRIYKRPVVLRNCGIKVRGRSSNLRLNYRTTAQIGKWALNMIKGLNQVGFDGNESMLQGYRSLLKGNDPIVKNFATPEEEKNFIIENIKNLLGTYQPESICLVARKNDLLEDYAKYLEENGITCRVLDRGDSYRQDGHVRLGTMHRVKGLEFTCVFIVAVNEGVIPSNTVIKGSTDNLLCAERLQKEKSLLFVAATRARDLLFISSYGEPSRFLVDN